jgi:penicillin-binding protein activator
MRAKVAIAVSLFLLMACSAAVVHKINFSKDYNPAAINRIAILTFNRGDNVSVHRDVVADKFTAALVDSRFKLVDRTDIKKVMEEVKFQQTDSGIIDEKTKQKLRQLGADTVMTGTLHTYTEDRRNNFIHYSEVYLTAKMLKVETGEVLWSGEIMKNDKAKNVGEKKILNIIDRESEAAPAGKLLDDMISEMADSFKDKKKLFGII